MSKTTGTHLKVKNFGTNAQGVELLGDKKNPEHDTFIVYFPGGFVEITRCTNNDYWAHVGTLLSDNSHDLRCDGRKIGKVIDASLYNEEKDIQEITEESIKRNSNIHFRVLITTR
jgi:hypothetical protein